MGKLSYTDALASIDDLATVDNVIADDLRALLNEPGCGDECCEKWEDGIMVGIGQAAKTIAATLRRVGFNE